MFLFQRHTLKNFIKINRAVVDVSSRHLLHPVNFLHNVLILPVYVTLQLLGIKLFHGYWIGMLTVNVMSECSHTRAENRTQQTVTCFSSANKSVSQQIVYSTKMDRTCSSSICWRWSHGMFTCFCHLDTWRSTTCQSYQWRQHMSDCTITVNVNKHIIMTAVVFSSGCFVGDFMQIYCILWIPINNNCKAVITGTVI